MTINRRRKLNKRNTDRLAGLPSPAARVLAAVVLLALTLQGCGEAQELVGDPCEAYMAVIHALEKPDQLSGEPDLRYIAVDTRNMAGFAEKEDKKAFLAELEDEYGLEVLDKNQVQLARDGYLTENSFNDGVLFKIREVEYSTYEKSPVVLEVQEWGRGAETMLLKRFVLEAEQGEWEIADVSDVTEREVR